MEGDKGGLLLSTRGSIVCLLWVCNISLYLSRTNISVAIVTMYPDNKSLEGELLAALWVEDPTGG